MTLRYRSRPQGRATRSSNQSYHQLTVTIADRRSLLPDQMLPLLKGIIGNTMAAHLSEFIAHLVSIFFFAYELH